MDPTASASWRDGHDVVAEGPRWPAMVMILLAAVLSAVAIWLHYPGHISMDSSMQVIEASTGRSETWNPPHTSALLRWFGPGPAGVGRLMAFNAICTYLALALSAVAAFRAGPLRSPRSIVMRAAAAILVIANPVIGIYVGIVWKDVVFATFLAAGVAAGLMSCVAARRPAIAWAVASALLLAFAMRVRQQGIFMAPVLLVLPMLGAASLRGLSRSRAAAAALSIVLAFGAGLVVFDAAVARTIHQDDRFGSQVGFNGLMQYDIAGMVARSQTPSDRLPIAMNDELRAQVRSVYSADRGDFLWYSPAVTQWLSLPGYGGVRKMWWAMVRAEPKAYAAHRLAVFRSILDVDGVKACLPVHVGIDGDNARLSRLGFVPGLDRYDQSIYDASRGLVYWPIFRHFAYAIALVLVTLLILFSPMHARLKRGTVPVAIGTALLYASYLPTSIACDFRYLYPAVCLVSMLWLVWLGAARGRPAFGRRRP
ncbi:hypothetical protein [Cognatilysobacter segetis]|uniref:hypothetical protein n=1 Tax=Cognatilysobacter segetis TaxID=2492394 RepID=UPI001390038C|nr:hypothetical protein [Lysobacter segetis]